MAHPERVAGENGRVTLECLRCGERRVVDRGVGGVHGGECARCGELSWIYARDRRVGLWQVLPPQAS